MPPSVVVAFCDSGAGYKCHDLLTYVLSATLPPCHNVAVLDRAVDLLFNFSPSPSSFIRILIKRRTFTDMPTEFDNPRWCSYFVFWYVCVWFCVFCYCLIRSVVYLAISDSNRKYISRLLALNDSKGHRRTGVSPRPFVIVSNAAMGNIVLPFRMRQGY